MGSWPLASTLLCHVDLIITVWIEGDTVGGHTVERPEAGCLGGYDSSLLKSIFCFLKSSVRTQRMQKQSLCYVLQQIKKGKKLEKAVSFGNRR